MGCFLPRYEKKFSCHDDLKTQRLNFFVFSVHLVNICEISDPVHSSMYNKLNYPKLSQCFQMRVVLLNKLMLYVLMIPDSFFQIAHAVRSRMVDGKFLI